MSNEVQRAAVTDCPVCRQLLLEGPDTQTFVVAPADGGGWHQWSAALLRLVRRIGSEPTRALIVSQQPLTQRYLQCLIGHGIAEVQASSNVYLRGSSRLSTGEEALLARLGWQPPDRDHDDPELMPANWWVPRIAGDWPALVELLSATAIVALGFDERFPVSVHTFGCDRPCRACSWPDAFPHTDREEPDE